MKLIFTFIRANKVCFGQSTNAEASGLSSLGFLIVCGRVCLKSGVLPLGMHRLGQTDLWMN